LQTYFAILSKVLASTAQHKELTDVELMHLYLQTQNSSYFTQLYRRYAPKVYGKCISILKDQTEAQDAVQDIFVKVMLNLSGFNEKSQFSTWVYSITFNYCMDVVRKRKKNKLLFSDDIERAPDVADEEIPDSYFLDLSLPQLKEILNELPEGDRLVILYKYQDDMSIKEISEIIDKTESATKMKIKRAKMKAAEIFQRKFGTGENISHTDDIIVGASEVARKVVF
jgi:RNA polymerase sigma factor (sigma-70 family)